MEKCPKCGGQLVTVGCVACGFDMEQRVVSVSMSLTAAMAMSGVAKLFQYLANTGALTVEAPELFVPAMVEVQAACDRVLEENNFHHNPDHGTIVPTTIVDESIVDDFPDLIEDHS